MSPLEPECNNCDGAHDSTSQCGSGCLLPNVLGRGASTRLRMRGAPPRLVADALENGSDIAVVDATESDPALGRNLELRRATLNGLQKLDGSAHWR